MPRSDISSSSSRSRRYIGRLSLTKTNGSISYFNCKRTISIGRGPECSIRIKAKVASRLHCQVRLVKDGEFLVENMSTVNTTLLNHRELTQKVATLKHGDVITVAERDFVFQLIDTMEGQADNGGEETRAGAAVAANTADNSTANTVQPRGLYSILCGAPEGQYVVDQTESEKDEEKGGCAIM